MKLGRIVGRVWPTQKHSRLTSVRLALVVPIDNRGSKSGDEFVAADLTNAGEGQVVLVAFGDAARLAMENPQAVVDAAIIALIANDGQHEGVAGAA